MFWQTSLNCQCKKWSCVWKSTLVISYLSMNHKLYFLFFIFDELAREQQGSNSRVFPAIWTEPQVWRHQVQWPWNQGEISRLVGKGCHLARCKKLTRLIKQPLWNGVPRKTLCRCLEPGNMDDTPSSMKFSRQKTVNCPVALVFLGEKTAVLSHRRLVASGRKSTWFEALGRPTYFWWHPGWSSLRRCWMAASWTFYLQGLR